MVMHITDRRDYIRPITLNNSICLEYLIWLVWPYFFNKASFNDYILVFYDLPVLNIYYMPTTRDC